MALIEPGRDSVLAQQAKCGAGLRLARVMAVDRGRYVVRNEQGEVPAELTGKFFTSPHLRWICPAWAIGCVSSITMRIRMRASMMSFLATLSCGASLPGKNIDFQMIAANIDVAFIVQSCYFDFNVRRLERYLVMVNEGQIEPVLLLTKTDMVSAEELARMLDQIRAAGITARIITLSNVTGEGVDLAS